jgi:hypothetical protein
LPVSALPVAAFSVTGPIDVIGAAKVGVLDEDLRVAARAALDIDATACRAHALKFTRSRCVSQFLDNILMANEARPRAA